MAESIVTLRVDTSQATRALKGVQNQTNTLSRAVGGLKTAFAGVGFTLLAKQAINASANFNKLNLRLSLLTKATGQFAEAQAIATEGQKLFGMSATEALEGVTNITARLAPLGVSLEDIRQTFLGFNTAAKLGGASTMEATAAFRQLAQALGSGRLAGDEFRSVSEQVPLILKPLSEELGVSTGELKKLAAEGKLTSDVVIRALSKLSEEGQTDLKAILEADPTQVFKNLSNAGEALSITVGNMLSPAVLGATKALTALIKTLSDFLNTEAGQVTAIFTGTALAVKALTVVVPLVTGKLVSLAASFQIAAANSFLASTGLKGVAASSFIAAGGLTNAAIAAHALKIALATTGIGLLVVGLGFLATAFLKANNEMQTFNTLLESGSVADIDAQLKATKDKVDELKFAISEVEGGGTQGKATKLRLGRDLEKANEELNKLQTALDAAEARQLTNEFNIQLDTLKEQNKQLTNSVIRSQLKTEEEQKAFDLETQIAEIRKQFSGEEEQRLVSLAKQNHELKQQEDQIKANAEAAKNLDKVFEEIGNSIATGVSDALVDAVMQTKSLAESAKALLNDIARQFLRLGINTALSTLGGPFASLPTFATGGRPTVGQAALIGEKGPELFVPSVAGTVIPNNKLGGGGAVTINVSVDATGSNVEGDEEEGRELGRLIAAAVQSEIVQQKRAGGLLA